MEKHWPTFAQSGLLSVLEKGGLHSSQCSEAEEEIGLVGGESSHWVFFSTRLKLIKQSHFALRLSHTPFLKTAQRLAEFNRTHRANAITTVVKDPLYKQSLGGGARHARGGWGGATVKGCGQYAYVMNTAQKQHQRQLRTNSIFTAQIIYTKYCTKADSPKATFMTRLISSSLLLNA